MIKYNPQFKSDGTQNGALTSAPSDSIIFDVPGKCIWVKGVKLATSHTYTFSHDNYITLTNTPGEPEDILIGVNTTALKNAIDTTYGIVNASTNGLAPMFSTANKSAANAATTYNFLGIVGTTLKWYQLPWRNIRINSDSTDKLGVNDTDPLIISQGTGISVTWDSTNKKIVITNTSPDVNHNTDRTGIIKSTVSGTKKTDTTLIVANSSSGLIFEGGTNLFKIGDGTNYVEIPVTPSFTVTDKSASILSSLTTLATINGTDIKAKVVVDNKAATIGTSLTTIATIAGVDITAKIGSYAASDHTHPLSIAGDSGTSSITLAASTKYKLTAGGSTYVFTSTPDENVKQSNNDNNQNSPILLKNGTGTGNITSGTIFADGVTINPSSNSLGVTGDINLGGTIYFGKSGWHALMGYNSTYSKYGIWYNDANTDQMTFSASGNANTAAGADFCINGAGDGTLTARGNLIAHAGNISNKAATIGTSLTTIATIAGVDITAKINPTALEILRSINGSTHAVALLNEFTNNKSSIPRNKLINYYSSAYSNGSLYFGYFLSGYDSNPYGGFYVCHYDTPYYVGISNGTFTQQQIITSTSVSPSLPISGNTIAVTVGGVTSSYITVPYATRAGTLDGMTRNSSSNWSTSGLSMIMGMSDSWGGDCLWLTNKTGLMSFEVDGCFYQRRDSGGSFRVVDVHDLESYYTKSVSDGRYVYKSGDTMTGSLAFNTTSTNHIEFTSSTYYTGGASEHTSIGYGRFQCWGQIRINADTDESKSEYCLITSGRGVSDSTADGLAVGYNTLTWLNNTIWHAGNDGSGSGLDADLLDGYHASDFATLGHNHDGRYARTHWEFASGSDNANVTCTSLDTWVSRLSAVSGISNYGSISSGAWWWVRSTDLQVNGWNIRTSGAMMIYCGDGSFSSGNYKHFLVLDAYADLYGITSNEASWKYYARFLSSRNYTDYVNPRAVSKTIWGQTYIDANGNFQNVDGKLTINDNITSGGTTNSLLNILFNGTHEYGVVMKIHSYGGDSPGIRFSHSSSASELNSQVNTNWTIGMYYNTYDRFAITQDRGTNGWGTHRLVINNSGNVGIGTDSPSYKLHVIGNGYFSQTIYGAGQPAFQTAAGAGNWNYIRMHNGSNFWDFATLSSSNSGALEFRPAGASNIGPYITPNGMFHFNNISNSSYNYDTAAVWIREYHYSGAGSDTWGQAPRLAWHWGGRVAALIGLASNGWLYEAPLTATNFYRIVVENGDNWNIRIAAASTASSWLDGLRYNNALVNATNNFDSSSYWPLIRWTSGSVSRWGSIGVLGANLYFMSSTTSRTSNGYDTAAYLDYTSSCWYAAHYYEHSDARLKHDIMPISQSIRKFYFNNDDRLYYGFIAQELETLHPELVDSSGEYKTVNYNSAICYYIAELENKVQKLEDEINKLKNK